MPLSGSSEADGMYRVSRVLPFTHAERSYVVLVRGNTNATSSGSSRARTDLLASLTRAERAVLTLMLEGYSDREIATKRGVSWHTISKQLSAIYRKTGTSGRVAMIRTVGID